MTGYGRPVRTGVVVVLAVGVIALVYIVNSGSADDEDTTTEATVAPDNAEVSLDPGTGEISTETVGDGPAIDRKRCGTYGRWRLAVYGDVPCPLARHAMRGYAHDRVPAPRTAKDRTTASLICPGRHVECGAIVARRLRPPT
jgi:hypothetical protein